ncbi:MAG: c-type cytochrome [Acidobacteriota bacterium]
MGRRYLLHLPLALGLGAGALLLAHEPEPSRYDYRKDVLPIVKKHCGSCHYPGGIAPMSLLQYQQTVPWAQSMKLKVLEGVMPPWLPEEEVGEFRGARSLSAEEIEILVDWASGGTPEGGPVSEEPQAAGPGEGWGIGTPDLILEPSQDEVVGADEAEKTSCVVLPTGLDETRWVSALAFQPGNPSMVHDVRIAVADTCEPKQRPLATWLPGDGAMALPDGVAERLPAGASLALSIHYRKTWLDDGKVLKDRSRVGLYFVTGGEPVRAVRIEGSEYRFLEEVRLLSVFPDPVSPEPIEMAALTSDGEKVPLLRIDAFDPAWRAKYVFRRPLSLPAGTVLTVTPPAVWVDYLPATENGK